MKKVIISGGGTGGHIFPALSIANALKRLNKDIEILFVGAEGKMEMEKVPEAGYKIVGLPVRGLQRKLTLNNLKVLWNLWRSLKKAKRVVREFKPDAVVGVGGYASGPIGKVATNAGIPLVLQEQNSYAGVTNKFLAKKAVKICVAYEGMERFFPKEKII
ncbi:MAG: UDP-N-acetylglucosamine--N-acetylmuramyl-(pentapeptide) pyrophosphoryl-undecaprenol N-acetylglucosamine transferase, partial [Butyricimonas faecihominis]